MYPLVWLACQSNPYVQGARLYEFHCSPCHMMDGLGMAALYPPLAQADYLRQNLSNLPCIIKHGLGDTINVNGVIYDFPMKGMKTLTNTEIANICNYIIHRWYPAHPITNEQKVRKSLKSCAR